MLSGCAASALWSGAQDLDSVEAYRAFLARYPHHERASTALRRIETLVFRDALRDGSVRAFRRYLADYPDGAFAVRASEGLVQARRRDALQTGLEQALRRFWARHRDSPGAEDVELALINLDLGALRREPTLQRARELLELYPRGPHVEEVRALAGRLAFDEANRLSDPTAWRRYLALLPAGPRRLEAEAGLEAALARQAIASGDEVQLRSFLRDHQASSHASDVLERLSLAMAERAERTFDVELAEAAHALAPRGGAAQARAHDVRASLRRAGPSLARGRQAALLLERSFPVRNLAELREALGSVDQLDAWEAVREIALSDDPGAVDLLLDAVGAANPLTSYYACVSLAALVARTNSRPAVLAHATELALRQANPEDRLRLGAVRDAAGERALALDAYEAAASSPPTALTASVLVALRAKELGLEERYSRIAPQLISLVRDRFAATTLPGRDSPDARSAALPGAARSLSGLEALTAQLVSHDPTRMDDLDALRGQIARQRERAEAEARLLDARFRSAGQDPIAARAEAHSHRRVAACLTLELLRDPRARPILQAAAQDADPLVAAAAQRALDRMRR